MQSEEWKAFQAAHPEIPDVISLSTFKKCIYGCVVPPTPRTCVDVIRSQQDYYQRAIARAITHNPTFKRALDECNCHFHSLLQDGTDTFSLFGNRRSPSSEHYVDWVRHLYKPGAEFLSLSMCPKIEYQGLKLPGHEEGPKLHCKACAYSSCEECGIDRRFNFFACPILRKYDKEIRVIVWQDASRSRDGSRTQFEPCEIPDKPFNEVLLSFEKHCKKAMQHIFDCSWTKTGMDRLPHLVGNDRIIINADFAAAPKLEANETDNCSEANSMVLEIIDILSNFRNAIVKNDDNEEVEIKINDCTLYASIARSDGVGKQNDFRHHIKTLFWAVKREVDKAKERGVDIVMVDQRTDNCSGQFKNQYHAMITAAFAKYFPNIKFRHSFAQRYNFKGVHDNSGKSIKNFLKSLEKKSQRVPDAPTSFKKLFNEYSGSKGNWKLWEEEKSVNLFHQKSDGKNIWAITHCEVLYVAQDQVEFDEFRTVENGIYKNNVTFLDCNAPFPTIGDRSAKGILTYFDSRGERAPVDGQDASDPNCKWRLHQAALPCFCDACSSSSDNPEEKCPYEDIRKGGKAVGRIWEIVVSDVSADPKQLLRDMLSRFVKETYFQKGNVNQERLKAQIRAELPSAEADREIAEATTQRAPKVTLMKVLYLHKHPEARGNLEVPALQAVQDLDDDTGEDADTGKDDGVGYRDPIAEAEAEMRFEV